MNKKYITNGALVLLGAISTGFIAATIVLIINNHDLSDEIDRCEIRAIGCGVSVSPETTSSIETTKSIDETTPDPDETSTSEPPSEVIVYRLPDTIKPTLYELYLHPDLSTVEEFFLGKVSITLEVLKRTNQIILHSHSSLEIDRLEVQLNDGVAEDQLFEFINTTDFLVVSLKDYIDIGTDCKLIIEYSGTLKDKLVGFYMSEYLTGISTMKPNAG